MSQVGSFTALIRSAPFREAPFPLHSFVSFISPTFHHRAASVAHSLHSTPSPAHSASRRNPTRQAVRPPPNLTALPTLLAAVLLHSPPPFAFHSVHSQPLLPAPLLFGMLHFFRDSLTPHKCFTQVFNLSHMFICAFISNVIIYLSV